MSKLRRLLIKHEGLRLHPYKDTVGKWTLGIGRNLDDKGISEAEAVLMLDNDIADCKEQLDRNIPWWRGLNGPRMAVMVSMCFNLGIGGLLRFKKTLAAIEGEEWDIACIEMLDSKWARQVGGRANDLAQMMRTGEW